MCLIVIKPIGAALPTDTEIATSWANNDDGFGLAWADGKRVHIRKGGMTLEQAIHLIAEVPDPINKNMIMHFRFATAGRVNPGNTHPYPITTSITKIRATNISCQVALAHNGHILSSAQYNDWSYSPEYEAVQSVPSMKEDKLTDTQHFILDFLADIPPKVLANKGVLRLVGEATSSKFALLFPDRIFVIGEFQEHEHRLYSNGGYNHVISYTPTPLPVTTETTPKSINFNKMAKCDLCSDWTHEDKMHYFHNMALCHDCFDETASALADDCP